ncbi:MAG: DUF502 domain-containing protein [Flavipsychrobacter sp.]
MRRILSISVRSFLQGLLILSPIAVTAYIIYTVFDSIDSLIPEMPRGIGFISIIAVITLIGYLGTRFLLGRILFEAFDYLMQHIPGIKFLYTSIKEIMVSFVGDKKKFTKPVWIRTNNDPEVWRIGFLTQENMDFADFEDKVAVYLPHAYAVSGWVVVVESHNIKPVTGMSAAQAMKFAVSGGVTSLEEEQNVKIEDQF